MDGGVDTQLLRGPRLDRPRTIDRSIPALGNLLIDPLDVVSGDPATYGLDRDREFGAWD
jgi:hypothetical protein